MGTLFVVSPIACIGVVFFIQRINASHIDHAAARGLTADVSSGNNSTDDEQIEYKPPSTISSVVTNKPSFIFGTRGAKSHKSESSGLQPETPLQVLRHPTLLIFLVTCFLFHTANGMICVFLNWL